MIKSVGISRPFELVNDRLLVDHLGGNIASGTVVETCSAEAIQTGTLLYTLPPFPASIWSLAWSPDGSKLVAGLDDGGVYLWNCASAETEIERLGVGRRTRSTHAAS